jgi:hypothetical protein
MQETINSWRNSKKVRIGFIIFLMIVLVVLYFRNVNTDKMVTIEGASGELQQQLVPDTWEKKIFLGLFGILGAALGMEASNYDLDLGKLVETKGDLKASKVLRDKTGNVVYQQDIDSGKVKSQDVKYTDEYNCDDFKTQKEAQTFYDNAGGIQHDTNRLDGNKDGVACQALPKN